MKTQLLFVLVAILMSKVSFADIILPHTHYVSKCVKITNLEDYPEVTFVGYGYMGGESRNVTELSSTICLDKGYKFNHFAVCAINKSYLQGKELSKINFLEDFNVLISNTINPLKGYVHDSIPISGLEEYYKVVGFTESKVILYKWKQVTKYNNATPDLIEYFAYDGEVSPLYQKITPGVIAFKRPSCLEVFPNPANRNIHIRINDNYTGTIPVELITSKGEVLKSFNLNKSASIHDFDIPVAEVSKGAYLIKVKMEQVVEYEKIILN